MKALLIFGLIVLLNPVWLRGQEPEFFSFVKDTMSLTGEKKVLEGEYVETTLKNFSVVRMFKTNDNKYYLRFLVTTNFYFNKEDVLEIRSHKKSYYTDKIIQYKVSKTMGLYIVEIPKNYIAQLKDEGITSIYFSKAETDFTRQDANQIKKMARFFYESITGKKQN